MMSKTPDTGSNQLPADRSRRSATPARSAFSARHGERCGREVGRDARGIGAFRQKRHGDGARSGAEVEDARALRHQRQRRIDQRLGVGPGVERRRRHPEGPAIEFALAQDARDGLAPRAPCDQGLEALDARRLSTLRPGSRMRSSRVRPVAACSSSRASRSGVSQPAAFRRSAAQREERLQLVRRHCPARPEARPDDGSSAPAPSPPAPGPR